MHIARILGSALLATACGAHGQGAAPAGTPPPAMAEARASTAAPAAPAPRATVKDALDSLARVDGDLKKLWMARDRAAWVNENFITDDTDVLAADAESATGAYVSRAVHESTRFDGLALPPDARRQLDLLRLFETVPPPAEPALREELSGIETRMTSAYGKAKYCPTPAKGKKTECRDLGALSKTLRESRSYDELLDAWTGWHATARPARA